MGWEMLRRVGEVGGLDKLRGVGEVDKGWELLRGVRRGCVARG